MRPPSSAAVGEAATQKAARISIWLLAATPLVMLISYRVPSILLPLAMLPALHLLVRGEISVRPKSDWSRFFLYSGAALLVWCGVSAAWSADPTQSLQSTAKVAGIVFAAWLCGTHLQVSANLASPAWLRFLTSAFFAAALIICALMLVNYLALSDRFETEEYKNIYIVGPSGNVVLRSWYNQAAAFLILSAWIVAAVRLGRPVWVYAAILALTAVTAVSVGYWIGVVAIAGGVFVFAVALRFKRQISILMAVAVVSAAVSLPWVSSQFPSFEQAVETPPSGNPSFVHRTLIWRFVSDAIAEKPLLGWGMDGSRHIPGGNERIPMSVNGVPKNFEHLPLHPHNSFLQLWLELGAVGALLFSVIVCGLYALLGRVNMPGKSAELYMGALTSALMMMGASFSLWSNWWLAAMGIVAVTAVLVTRIHERRSGLTTS